MTFDKAISAHKEWKVKLLLFLNDSGRLEEASVQNDRLCPVGNWLYGLGQQYKNYDEFQALKDDHAAFHREAAEIVRLIKEGKKQDAKDLLAPHGNFSKLLQQVDERASRLRYRLRQPAA